MGGIPHLRPSPLHHCGPRGGAGLRAETVNTELWRWRIKLKAHTAGAQAGVREGERESERERKEESGPG